MARMSFRARVRVGLTGGLLFLTLATTQGTAASSAEIKVLTSVALTSALDELAPQIERATGNKLTIGYGLISDIRKRILEGESADVIILSRPVMDELDKQSKFASEDCAGSGSASARPASRRVRQHDTLHRRDWRHHQGTGGSEIAYPIPHRTGR